MEVAPCAQQVMRHAALLLAYLNLQRKQGQFCDLVLRQRQNPGQLYPAHRCVLAASSPVLASVLCSAGALVELQAPCLSDSVLAPLLDYVYTGDLPYTYSQQQYYSLLTAACYLQMDELQKALRARQQTEVCATDSVDTSAESEKNTYRTTVNTSPDTPSTSSILTFRRPEETDNYSVQSMTASPENMEPFNETQMHSADMDCSTDEIEMDTARNRRDHSSGRDARTLSNPGTPCGILERSESGINAGHDRQETSFTLNVPSIAEVHVMSEVDKEMENDQFNPVGIWQRYTDNTLVRTAENRKSSSSSPHPYCGAVPVICHSSRTAISQLADISAVSPYHLSPKASGSSRKSPVSRSASTDNDSIAEGISSKYKCQYKAQIQEYGHDNKHTVTQSLDNKDNLNQCALQDSCYSADRSDMLKQDYNSSDTHNCVMHNQCVDSGSSHITDHNNQYAHCDSFQNNTQNLKKDSVSPEWSKELKYKTDFKFDDCLSKQKRQDFFEFFSVPSATATEEPGHLRAEVPLTAYSVEDSNTENLGLKGEVKEEHSYSSSDLAETDTQDSHCNLYEPKKNRHSIMYRADTNANNAATSHDSNYRPTTVENKEDSVDFFPTSESHSTFTMPLDRHMSNTSVDSVVGHSYHGHLHYHCLQQDDMQEDVHVHGSSHHKHSHTNYYDDSDDSSDEEAFGAFESPLKQHYSSTETTDQFLLLDISTKPAELLVSHKHRSGTEEKFENEMWADNGAQRKEETSVASVEGKTSTARAKFGTERFDMADAHWAVKTKAEERKSVVQNSPGVETMQTPGAVWDVSNLKKGETQTSTSTDCSPPSVSNSVQASVSACMPSALSSSMPADRSVHLSTPVHHPFQCSLCDRSFSQRGSLNRHVRSHLGVRPFPCPRCPMTFSRQYRVTEHMRVHQRCASGNDFQKPPASST